MQSRRHFLGLFAVFAATRCAVAPGSTRSDPPTPQRLTVTLAISGMTWEGCVEPVRSALAAVKGVSLATVSFERHEASVEYDPTQCRVDDLLAAVAGIKDPTMPATFRAAVKK